jgi:hypothetical protein
MKLVEANRQENLIKSIQRSGTGEVVVGGDSGCSQYILREELK